MPTGSSMPRHVKVGGLSACAKSLELASMCATTAASSASSTCRGAAGTGRVCVWGGGTVSTTT